MSDGRVWGGLLLGDSPEAVKDRFPLSREHAGEFVLDWTSFGTEFEVKFAFEDGLLSSLEIGLIRLLTGPLKDVRAEVVHALQRNHGRGRPARADDDCYQRIWNDENLVVELVAVDDADFPVLSVSYRSVEPEQLDPWRY